MMWLVLLVGIAVLVLIGMTFSLRKRPGISASERKKIMKQWQHVLSLHDANAQILEADKILDVTLGALGYQGSVADKLKAAGPRLKNLDAIWRAHKLRNRIAHEPGVQVTEREAKEAMGVFERIIMTFIR